MIRRRLSNHRACCNDECVVREAAAAAASSSSKQKKNNTNDDLMHVMVQNTGSIGFHCGWRRDDRIIRLLFRRLRYDQRLRCILLSTKRYKSKNQAHTLGACPTAVGHGDRYTNSGLPFVIVAEVSLAGLLLPRARPHP